MKNIENWSQKNLKKLIKKTNQVWKKIKVVGRHGWKPINKMTKPNLISVVKWASIKKNNLKNQNKLKLMSE